MPWIKNFYLFTYIGISQRAKYNYPYLCPILHQFLISKAVCSKNSDRRNQMALDFFLHSWKNLLASTPRKSWGVTKKILSASAISFHFRSFHFYYVLTLPVEILSVEQTAAKFFTNSSWISDWIPLAKAAGFAYYSLVAFFSKIYFCIL